MEKREVLAVGCEPKEPKPIVGALVALVAGVPKENPEDRAAGPAPKLNPVFAAVVAADCAVAEGAPNWNPVEAGWVEAPEGALQKD